MLQPLFAPLVRIVSETLLSDNWNPLKKYIIEQTSAEGRVTQHMREVYHRTPGAAVLLYNRAQKTVVLVRQFRLPVRLVQSGEGMLVEACAGLLDQDDPLTCIRREIEEETGYVVAHIQAVLTVFISPGATTEQVHLFTAEYDPAQRKHAGGGLAEEGEEIEVVEWPFEQVLAQVRSGEINDAKTVILIQHAALSGIFDARLT